MDELVTSEIDLRKVRRQRRAQGRPILTDDEVVRLLWRYWQDRMSNRAVAAEFCVSGRLVAEIVSRWAYHRGRRMYVLECERLGVPSQPDRPEPVPRLSWDGLIRIAEWEYAGMDGPRPCTATELAKSIGISRTALYKILRGELHEDALSLVYEALEANEDPRVTVEPWW